jgi:uncharacterized protein YcbK (DUF882 family)
MGDLTKNISKSELFCHCKKCNVRIQDHEPVIAIVQGACDYFAVVLGVEKVRLEIPSPARCRDHNLAIGSNDESQHIRCNAMDIKIYANGIQIPPGTVYQYFNDIYPHSMGVGLYDTFTHIDSREKRARW